MIIHKDTKILMPKIKNKNNITPSHIDFWQKKSINDLTRTH